MDDPPLQTSQLPVDPSFLRARDSFKRRHGFQWPWHPFQVASWLYLVFSIFVMYYVNCGKAFNAKPSSGLRETVSVLYGLSCLAAIVSGAVVTHSDPTDPIVQNTQIAKQRGESVA
jgi:hypothetical protein